MKKIMRKRNDVQIGRGRERARDQEREREKMSLKKMKGSVSSRPTRPSPTLEGTKEYPIPTSTIKE